MRTSDELRAEHRLIERVLDGLEGLAERLRRGEPVAPGLMDAVLDFLTRFVEQCHHGKEEALLPALAARGVAADATLLADLRAEHDEGRRRLGALRAGADLGGLLRSYVAFVRAHIAREDGALLPIAEQTLSAHDEGPLRELFASIQTNALGPGDAEALRRLVDTLAEACRHGVAPTATLAAVAADVMRPQVPTLHPDDTLARAAETMTALGVRELPVAEDGRPVGIVTQRDLEPHRGHFEWTRVRTAMTNDPVTVAPHTPARRVAQLLVERCYNAVPVVAEGIIVGMIARSDLLRLLLG